VSIIELVTWVNEFPSSIALRESTWTYPIIESVHSVAIALFFGVLLFWDLRLLGIGLRRVPVSHVWAKLSPWFTLGALIMIGTGLALFYSKPVYFWGNVYFRVKLIMLVLAGLNIGAFHLGVEKRLHEWDTAANPPTSAKLAGASSIILWAAVIVFGRLIAYNWYAPLF
jgi:hypothetical protein